MTEMTELVSVEAFARALTVVCGGWVAACLLVAVVALARGRRRSATWAALCGLLAPLVLGLWQFHSYMVRVDPATGYVGLHHVSVFLVCAVAFVAVGALVGWGLGRLSGRLRDRDDTPAREDPGA